MASTRLPHMPCNCRRGSCCRKEAKPALSATWPWWLLDEHPGFSELPNRIKHQTQYRLSSATAALFTFSEDLWSSWFFHDLGNEGMALGTQGRSLRKLGKNCWKSDLHPRTQHRPIVLQTLQTGEPFRDTKFLQAGWL